MGRPPRISRQDLQRAALAIVDANGADGLSMRSLAAAVGSGAMTLYRHVADRADLDLLVVDAVLSQATWSREPAEDWRDEVREIAEAGWQAVRAHPHAIPLILTRRTRSPVALEMAEAMLAALVRGGHGGTRLLVAFRAITAFIMGFAQSELAGPLAVAASQDARETVERMRSLPPDRFPCMTEVAAHAAASDPADEFRSGLELLLSGLAAIADPPHE